MIRTHMAAQAAQAIQAAKTTTTSRPDFASALPGEWLTLWLLVVLAAVLGAAVLARGAADHRRLQAQRVEQWREWRAERLRRPEQGEHPVGRDCG